VGAKLLVGSVVRSFGQQVKVEVAEEQVGHGALVSIAKGWHAATTLGNLRRRITCLVKR
jgi:hypothetical protein